MDDADELQFCWDDGKAASNFEKHGVSFEQATYLFDDVWRVERGDLFAEGEYRSIAIGRVHGKLLTVIYTALGEHLYRIISARFATRSERDDYEQDLFHS